MNMITLLLIYNNNNNNNNNDNNDIIFYVFERMKLCFFVEWWNCML